MKGRASGPASRSGFSAASSAVRHEASSASRRTFSFAARTGAFLPVRAALFSRPCRNALPVGRCLPAGVCPCGAPGRDAFFPPLPFRGGRPFSRKGRWGKRPLPSSLPWESGRHAPAGRRAAEACSSACAVPGLRLFLRVRLFCTAFFSYPCGRSACFSCARARPPLCLKKRRPRAAHARALCRPGMEKTQARSMVCRMSGNICPYRG